MVDFRAAAVHGINSFLWWRLQEDLGWDKENYRGMVPITTPQQQQEFNDSSYPYIIYNYRMNTPSTNYVYKEDSILYVIIGNGPSAEGDVRQALHLMEYYFSSMDDSAAVVNDYISTLPTDSPFKAFDYKSIIPRGFNGADPPDQEGGITDAQANINVRYTNDRILTKGMVLP